MSSNPDDMQALQQRVLVASVLEAMNADDVGRTFMFYINTYGVQKIEQAFSALRPRNVLHEIVSLLEPSLRNPLLESWLSQDGINPDILDAHGNTTLGALLAKNPRNSNDLAFAVMDTLLQHNVETSLLCYDPENKEPAKPITSKAALSLSIPQNTLKKVLEKSGNLKASDSDGNTILHDLYKTFHSPTIVRNLEIVTTHLKPPLLEEMLNTPRADGKTALSVYTQANVHAAYIKDTLMEMIKNGAHPFTTYSGAIRPFDDNMADISARMTFTMLPLTEYLQALHNQQVINREQQVAYECLLPKLALHLNVHQEYQRIMAGVTSAKSTQISALPMLLALGINHVWGEGENAVQITPAILALAMLSANQRVTDYIDKYSYYLPNQPIRGDNQDPCDFLLQHTHVENQRWIYPQAATPATFYEAMQPFQIEQKMVRHVWNILPQYGNIESVREQYQDVRRKLLSPTTGSHPAQQFINVCAWLTSISAVCDYNLSPSRYLEPGDRLDTLVTTMSSINGLDADLTDVIEVLQAVNLQQTIQATLALPADVQQCLVTLDMPRYRDNRQQAEAQQFWEKVQMQCVDSTLLERQRS